MLDSHTINKLRKLGLTETAADGSEGIRISIQCRADLTGQSRQQRRETLGHWVTPTTTMVTQFGGFVVPESLSIAGQTIEAVIPLSAFESAEDEFVKKGERVDIVMQRQAVS